MADLVVSFPKPCSEDWTAMARRGCNRHCATCDTIIHDLSAMTVDQAEALLDSGEEICVRASVRPNGSIHTAGMRNSRSRRIVTVIAASVSLATAACQTTTPPVSQRYAVTGQVKLGNWSTNARLISDSGKSYAFTIRGDRKFRFTNLRPGTYSLSFYGSCGETHSFDNIAVNDDLNLGELGWNDEEDCIIIGVMQRADDVRDG